MNNRFLLTLVGTAFASGAAVDISYKIPSPTNAWRTYGSVDIPASVELTYDKEYHQGKVVSALNGDAVWMAEQMWEAYTPEVGIEPRLDFRIQDAFASVSLSTIRSERQLAKVLSHVEFLFALNDTDQSFQSFAVRIDWNQLEDLGVSRSRIGTVLIMKPILGSQVMVEDPLMSGRSDLNLDEDAIQGPMPPQQGFFGKYWYIVLGTMFIMNIMSRVTDNNTTEEPAQAAEVEQRPAQQATAPTRKKGKK